MSPKADQGVEFAVSVTRVPGEDTCMSLSTLSQSHTVEAVPHPAPAAIETKPLLILFSSRRSGLARRVEGYVAHVLQRRHNHESFRFRVVDVDDRPDLFERFDISEVPSIVVIENRRVRRRLEGYSRPNEIEQALQAWLH